MPRGVRRPADHEIVTSAILGVATLVDVISEPRRSRWFHGPFGFLLADVRPLRRPIRCKGGQKLWDLPTATEDFIRREISPTTLRKAATPQDVAAWMVAQLNAAEDVELNQQATARQIAKVFGREFIRPEPNGVLSIDRRVLRYFRLWTADTVVFVTHPLQQYTPDAYWRKRTPRDAPGRRQSIFD
jgi:hypothetical protein